MNQLLHEGTASNLSLPIVPPPGIKQYSSVFLDPSYSPWQFYGFGNTTKGREEIEKLMPPPIPENRIVIKPNYSNCSDSTIYLPSFIPLQPKQIFKIDQLIKFRLKKPLYVTVEKDGPGFLAKCKGLPLYGYDEDLHIAVNKLKQEIENLFIELEEDQNYSSEWKVMHSFLRRIINR